MAEELLTDEEDLKNVPILIKTFGEFWSPDVVNWNDSWRLMGRSGAGADTNIYEERGVYVLYNDFVPVYVGKADRTSIGFRLQAHRGSQRKGPRWDRFSWFGIRGLDKDQELCNLRESVTSPSTELIATLEALLIIVIDPRLNSRREKLKNATQFYQSDADRPTGFEERLESIEQKLDELLLVNRLTSLLE